MNEDERRERVVQILEAVKPLAVAYYDVMRKPLGVTGELAEHAAAMKLGLELAVAREAGFDARRGDERIQIKGRVFEAKSDAGQRMGKIRLDVPCDVVLYVALDPKSLDPVEMWQASFDKVKAHIEALPETQRTRGLPVRSFKKLGHQVWPPNT